MWWRGEDLGELDGRLAGGTNWGPSSTNGEPMSIRKAPLYGAFTVPEEGLEPPTRGL